MDLHSWNTPNGKKPVILLEELDAGYQLHPVNISAGDQNEHEFLKISPNGKIPALVDGDLKIFESGAIAMHLAEKFGQFLPSKGQSRIDALAWTFWQVGGLGPMIGQWGHFLNADGDHAYALERYLSETLRLFDVLDQRLGEHEYLAGQEYTIADIMCWPWAEGGLSFLDKAAGDRTPTATNVRRWIGEISMRPSVIRALDISEQHLRSPEN